MGGKPSYECVRSFRSSFRREVLFRRQDDEDAMLELELFGRFKHQVYLMTLRESYYSDDDTASLWLMHGYSQICRCSLQGRHLTLVFRNEYWQRLWDTAPEIGDGKTLVFRWVSRVSPKVDVIVPLCYQWYVRRAAASSRASERRAGRTPPGSGAGQSRIPCTSTRR